MKKYIVLSVNDNVDYLYYTPLVCWAWEKFGWEPIIFYHGDTTSIMRNFVQSNCIQNFINIADIEGYRSDTITQISRLYAACLPEIGDNDYLMTSDIDMIPLTDYWKPEEGHFTVWGHDLTGFKNYPICYIGAQKHLWKQVMSLHNEDYNAFIKRDLDNSPCPKSENWYVSWETDQDHITKRLQKYGTGRINFINRGQGKHGFARGRVDKGDGGWVLDQPELIDCHMQIQTHHKEEKIKRLLDLLHQVWPKENWLWFAQYTKEFRKLAL